MNSNQIFFEKKQEVVTIYLDNLVDVLEKKYSTIFINKNVEIYKDENVSFRTVLSTINNIAKIDLDCNYSNEYCYITLLNSSKLTILKNEIENNKTLILPIKSLKQNEDLIPLDCIKNFKIDFPPTIKTEVNEKIKISFDEEDLNTEENKKNLAYLIGKTPNNIVDFREKNFTIKTYEKNEYSSTIRYKFVNETVDLKYIDKSFYDNIKIRISDKNNLKYKNYIFIITDNNNCVILSQDKKL